MNDSDRECEYDGVIDVDAKDGSQKGKCTCSRHEWTEEKRRKGLKTDFDEMISRHKMLFHEKRICTMRRGERKKRPSKEQAQENLRTGAG